MSLQSDKKRLEQQVNRYMTLLSNLDKPPFEYVEHLSYFKGLVQFANAKEIVELQMIWDSIKPKDKRSLTFIETGVVENSGNPQKTKAVNLADLLDLTDSVVALRQEKVAGRLIVNPPNLTTLP